MSELLALPTPHCAHWHSNDDRKPYLGPNGKAMYPAGPSAEYSAALVFTLAVAVCHWAVVRGYDVICGVAHISRLPAIECGGARRKKWTQWDSQCASVSGNVGNPVGCRSLRRALGSHDVIWRYNPWLC